MVLSVTIREVHFVQRRKPYCLTVSLPPAISSATWGFGLPVSTPASASATTPTLGNGTFYTHGPQGSEG